MRIIHCRMCMGADLALPRPKYQGYESSNFNLISDSLSSQNPFFRLWMHWIAHLFRHFRLFQTFWGFFFTDALTPFQKLYPWRSCSVIWENRHCKTSPDQHWNYAIDISLPECSLCVHSLKSFAWLITIFIRISNFALVWENAWFCLCFIVFFWKYFEDCVFFHWFLYIAWKYHFGNITFLFHKLCSHRHSLHFTFLVEYALLYF